MGWGREAAACVVEVEKVVAWGMAAGAWEMARWARAAGRAVAWAAVRTAGCAAEKGSRESVAARAAQTAGSTGAAAPGGAGTGAAAASVAETEAAASAAAAAWATVAEATEVTWVGVVAAARAAARVA